MSNPNESPDGKGAKDTTNNNEPKGGGEDGAAHGAEPVVGRTPPKARICRSKFTGQSPAAVSPTQKAPEKPKDVTPRAVKSCTPGTGAAQDKGTRLRKATTTDKGDNEKTITDSGRKARMAKSTTAGPGAGTSMEKGTRLRRSMSKEKPEREKTITESGRNRKVNFLKRGIRNMRQAFSSTGMQKSVKRAQEKQASLPKAIAADSSDDTFFDVQEVVEEELEKDDAEIFNDTTHNPDVVLIKNNDNNGKLHINGIPFWKESVAKKDKPAIDKKLLSNLLADVASGKVQLKEGIPDPDDLDEFHEMPVLEKRDKRYFLTDQILTNTIRSIVHTLEPDESLQTRKMGVIRSAPPGELVISEPTNYISYQKHHYLVKEEQPFKKSGIGVCKKEKKKKGGKHHASDSTSSTSSSSTSGKAPPPAAVKGSPRKKASIKRKK